MVYPALPADFKRSIQTLQFNTEPDVKVNVHYVDSEDLSSPPQLDEE